MAELNYPDVEEEIETALKQAVDYILNRFEHVVGIIAAGSLMRGEGDEHSDIDTFVITEGKSRQRVQKFFNGIPFELFVNAQPFIEQYIEEESHDGVAHTAHMLTTGHIIMHRSSVVSDLIQKAQSSLNAPPQYNQQALTFQRYMLADQIENGLDLRDRDPEMGIVLISAAIHGMLVYQFKKQGKWVPRHKDLLKILRDEELELVQLIEHYQRAIGDNRFELAGLIADYTLGVRGFFEWETEKDYLDS